ncbi:MAG: diacylglycerol/lipid kinase family protein [Anaerolineales bacterium]
MKTVIIYNPRAGRFETTGMLQSVSDALRRLDCTVDVWLTTAPGDSRRLAAEARDKGVDSVFIAGGDGSLNAAVQVLAGTDVILGVLPMGTANVWASELGLAAPAHPWSDALRDAAVRQALGRVRRVDVGVCNGDRFLLWAGLGLDAHIVSKVEPRRRFVKRFGRTSYLLQALWAALSWRGVQMTVRVNEHVLERELLAAVATNVRMYGGPFFRLHAAARIDDGEMSLRAFEGHSFLDAYKYLRALVPYSKAPIPEDHLLVGTHFTIDTVRYVNLQLDGEVMGRVRRAVIELQPAALNVFAPEARPLPIFSTEAGAEQG